MKAFRILALLMILGISQAGATGFAYNMNKAQKMLKCKVDPNYHRAITVETKLKLQTVRGDANVQELFEQEVEVMVKEEEASEYFVDTFTNWLTRLMVNLFTAGLGSRG